MTARDARLRELAMEATPGPWSAHEGDLEGKPASEYVRTLLANREADGTSTGRLFLTLAPNPIDPERGAEVVPALTGDGPSAEANAAYIAAASPDVLLGLLDRLAVVEAERDELARWKAEAIPVLDGLQEIGKALDLPLGTQITGPQALGAIEVLLAERDRLAAAVERVKALCESWRRISAAWSSLDVLTADEKADVEALGYRDGVRTAARDLRAVLSDAGRGK